MTFDDIRKFALLWPEVEDGTSYGTPALKVRKKMLARLKEDGDSLVMPGVPQDERAMLVESQAEGILLHRPLPRLSDGADPPVEGQARDRRAVAAAALAHAGVEEGGEGIRYEFVGWAKRTPCPPSRGLLVDGMVGTSLRSSAHPTAVPMNRNQFLTAALRNPANEIIAEELFRLALPDAWLVSGCLVQTVWNVLTGRAVDYGINDYDVFYFDPDTSWEAEDKIIRTLTERLAGRGIAGRGAQPGARASLVPRKARPALPGAALFDRGHRPLSDQEHADRNPAHAGGLRRVRAEWLRRCRRTDRAAQSGARIFRRRITRRRRRDGRRCGRRSRCCRRNAVRRPDRAQRNPGQCCSGYSHRVSLRSIRATTRRATAPRPT